MGQALQALTHLERLGILHADIKPQNMGVRGDGTLAIFDFGSAVYSPTRIIPAEQSEHLLATPQFAAPEVLRAVCGKKTDTAVDTRADVWAVAMVFYSTLTQSMPYVYKGERRRGRPVSFLSSQEYMKRVEDWMRGRLGPHQFSLRNPSREQNLLHGLCRELLQPNPKFRPQPGHFLAGRLGRGSPWDRALLIPISAGDRALIEQADKFEDEFPIGRSVEGLAAVRAERARTNVVERQVRILAREVQDLRRECAANKAAIEAATSSSYVHYSLRGCILS